MRIIYIHQYFKTPEEGGAVRSYHLAKGLVQAGHDVELITTGNNPTYDQRWIDGIKVHYLPVKYDQKFSYLKRIWAFIDFVKKSKLLLKKLKRPDLLYISSTPLTTGLIGLWAKKKLAIPYVFEVRDLWPRAPIEVGAIRNPLLISYLQKLEARIYQNALSLVALSPGIANHLRTICSQSTLHLIPNFSDLEQFQPIPKSDSILKKYGLAERFTIAYTGALGKVNAVEELIDLAELAFQRKKNWQFLIMGAGSHRASLEQIAQEKGLENVIFIPFGNKASVNEVLSLADFAWISFAPLPVLKTNSPNKFFDAIAAGKPVIINHKGWVYDLMKANQLGISCLPSKLEKSFSQLEALSVEPEKIQEMGRNSRKLAKSYFSKELAVSRLVHILNPDSSPSAQGDEVDILTA
jgi:glycosyltransferase involved in cell wall biosynthesis